MPKYIFVVGGVMSSVGKGVAAASISKIIQSRGYRVSNIKCDMYVNIDAGTIRPAEHGEVFVGVDGVEADQDLGNYERFTDQICTRDNYITTGQIYQEVIRRERNLEYGGEDVEVVPDVPNEIIRRIEVCRKKTNAEVMVIEFGGTVGEFQVLLFLEAARMMKARAPKDVSFVLVSYLLTPKLLGEQKSKPTQYAIRTLNSAGINPDIIMCRANEPASESIKTTISTVCSLPRECIISAPDVESIYDIPVNFEREGLGVTLLKTLGLKERKKNLVDFTTLAKKIKGIKKEVKIGVVGKYFNFKSCRDTYISVLEAINHAAWINNVKAELIWLDSEEYETNPAKLKELASLDGVVVPGGFGTRGVEGIISAIKYLREKNIPFLGLCYGLQLATIEFARNICGIKGATSTEMDAKSKDQVIHTMLDQIEKIQKKDYGATMRLGSYPCVLKKESKSYKLYKTAKISERHRHRYEVNNAYRAQLENKGLLLAGTSPDNTLVEVIELPKHPFFIATQFHPEFQSRPLTGHPLFNGFIAASLKRKRVKK
ncbi:MAG: CTP synthetase [Parcubacteria group bacterium GW2011_GWC2_38_7]|nr:MAG: CTP synthetase [Parcubacteria group bacterium GW2011_GWC2_38_7]